MKKDELTAPEIEKMKHCIGFSSRKTYKRRGITYFKPFRNYYDAGPTDVPVWECLLEKGYAEKNKCYWVTLEGLRVLSEALDVFIYSENASGNEIDAAQDIINVMLQNRFSTLSSDSIAFQARLPRRLTNDTLHYLRDQLKYVTCLGIFEGWQLSDQYFLDYPEKEGQCISF